MLLRRNCTGAIRHVCRRSRWLSPAWRLCRAAFSATSTGLLPAALLRATVLPLRCVLLPAPLLAPLPILFRIPILARPALRLLRASSVLGQALGRPRPSLVSAIHRMVPVCSDWSFEATRAPAPTGLDLSVEAVKENRLVEVTDKGVVGSKAEVAKTAKTTKVSETATTKTMTTKAHCRCYGGRHIDGRYSSRVSPAFRQH